MKVLKAGGIITGEVTLSVQCMKAQLYLISPLRQEIKTRTKFIFFYRARRRNDPHGVSFPEPGGSDDRETAHALAPFRFPSQFPSGEMGISSYGQR